MGRRLTGLAHEAVSQALDAGGTAVDATAGNGHDTCFLAGRVGVAGHVHAFDIQPQALEATRRRLRAARLTDRVTLHAVGHERMMHVLPPALRGRLDAAMFNLGYLPGGARDVTTRGATSAEALRQAATLLRPGGIATVLAYRGHPGGAGEATAIAAQCASLVDAGFEVRRTDSPGSGPVLWVLRAADAPAASEPPGFRPRRPAT